jgi:transposase-like protein
MTREMRREQVERCLAADMTVKEWCELNGVSKSTMYYWMARLRREEPGLFGDPTCGEWIELSKGSISARTALAVRPQEPTGGPSALPEGEAGTPARPSGALVVRVNGADVVVPEGASEAHLSMVLRAVASL